MSNQLHPAWYQLDPDGEITDLNLCDSLSTALREIQGIAFMLGCYGEQNEIHSPESISNVSLALCNRVEEIEALLDEWQRRKSTAKLQAVDS